MNNHQTNPLKRLTPRLLVAVLALFALAAASAQAASITFNTPVTITGDTDVSTIGTVLCAYDWANSAQTVNTVVFTGITGYSGSVGSLTMNGWSGANNTSAFTSTSTPFSGLTTAY
jgi:hypothetical protein